MMLGLCSTLAVTNSVRNSIAMSFGVIFVSVASSTIVSIIRAIIPSRIRLAVFMMIISTFTIVVDQVLKDVDIPVLAGEILAEKAAELRRSRRPRIGVGHSGSGVAQESVDHEDLPAEQ